MTDKSNHAKSDRRARLEAIGALKPEAQGKTPAAKGQAGSAAANAQDLDAKVDTAIGAPARPPVPAPGVPNNLSAGSRAIPPQPATSAPPTRAAGDHAAPPVQKEGVAISRPSMPDRRSVAPLKASRAARIAGAATLEQPKPTEPSTAMFGNPLAKAQAESVQRTQAAKAKRDAKANKGKTPAATTDHLPAGGAIAVIPIVPLGHREVELMPLIPDRAWVRILYDETAHVYLYEVIEPVLSPEEETVRVFLHDTLVRTLDGRKGRDGDWHQVLTEAIRQAIIDHSIRITAAGAHRIEYYLVRDFLGYGPIDVLMRDPMLEDISCDGPEIPLYLFHRKYESVRTNVEFKDEQVLDSFVIRLAQRSRKHISIADPLLDATMPDGSRLQATLSREVTTRGSSFTIRKFRADPMTPPDIVSSGTMSAEMAGWFWFAMEVGSSFLIAGGTASGKTTTLNAVSQFIPPEKKIVSIEDTREINLSHENWIAGVTRSGFGGEVVAGKVAGTIDMYKLLEAALRQRPEYLLVGEVRGPEALTLFQAMATGHAVYSTMHADSVQSAVYRLENEPINVPRMMLQTLDILAIQAQVRIGEKAARRITEITELVGYEPQTRELLTNTVFEWDPQTNEHNYLGKSYVLEQVMEARNLTEEQVEGEWRARVEVIEWMIRSNIRRVGEVANVISQYYRNPASLLERIRSNPMHGPQSKNAQEIAQVEDPAHGTE